MSNSLVHGVVNTLVYVLFALFGALPWAWGDWLGVFAFGIIFDLDHVSYFMMHIRPLTLQNLRMSIAEDYKQQIPHFYGCHTLEFQGVLICIYFGTGGAPWSTWLVAGWFFHLLTDVIAYLGHYHSFRPWAKYWSVGYYLVKRKSDHLV